MSKRWWSHYKIYFISLIFSSSIILLFFQNCADNGADSGDSTNLNSETDPKILNAPFAYEVRPNQITYMSCTDKVGSSQVNIGNQEAFFVFKAGSYDNTPFFNYPATNIDTINSGVRLNDTFMAYMNNKFKPPYGSQDMTSASPDQIKQVLQLSPNNKGAQVQMALRLIGFPETPADLNILTFDGKNTKLDNDFVNFAMPLSDDSMLLHLTQGRNKQWMRYFPANDMKKNFEGMLYFKPSGSTGYSENHAKEIRESMLRKYLLTFTFTLDPNTSDTSKNQPAYKARSLDGEGNKLYGAGYKVQFTQGTNNILSAVGGLNSKAPLRALASIQEVDLLNPTSSVANSNWICPEKLRLVIVSPSDEMNKCPPMTYEQVSKSPTDLSIIYRDLKPHLWRVNTSLRCAVPKVGTCYPESGVEYSQGAECYDGLNTNPGGNCAHYVSICLRGSSY